MSNAAPQQYIEPLGSRNQTMTSPTSQLPPPRPNFRFPQSFGLYHASGSLADYLIAQSKDDPSPIYYISTHSGLSSQPSVVLHCAADPAASPLATAELHNFSNTIDMSLYVALSPGSKPQLQEMESHGVFHPSRFFKAPIPSTGQLEEFEWRSSSCDEVQRLGANSHGKKCVRLSNGEVVAVFARQDWSHHEKGLMAFTGNRSILGEAFEVLAVMTMAAAYEKERRAKKRRNNQAVFGM